MLFNKDLLQGKVVLITGGSRGGMLADMAEKAIKCGAKVAMMARNKEKLQAVCSKVGAEAFQGDVSKIDSVK